MTYSLEFLPIRKRTVTTGTEFLRRDSAAIAAKIERMKAKSSLEI